MTKQHFNGTETFLIITLLCSRRYLVCLKVTPWLLMNSRRWLRTLTRDPFPSDLHISWIKMFLKTQKSNLESSVQLSSCFNWSSTPCFGIQLTWCLLFLWFSKQWTTWRWLKNWVSGLCNYQKPFRVKTQSILKQNCMPAGKQGWLKWKMLKQKRPTILNL